jgi:serine/threonine protein kinase
VALTTGSRVGPYEVKSSLSEGGMGVVFRALDTKLQREVAPKLLQDHFADDPERLARFQREAQVLVTLNHPYIAQIHGLEDSTAPTCIVMELAEGETLPCGRTKVPAMLRACTCSNQITCGHNNEVIGSKRQGVILC